MSAKCLKSSHAAYCANRVQQPKAIPMPEKITPKLKNILPITGVKQDVESDDDEADVFKRL